MPGQPQKVTLQDVMNLLVEINRKMDESFKQMNKKMDSFNKKLYDDQEIEGSKEIEIKEDQSVLLSENKNNTNEKNLQTMERKTKKMRQRKLINTREELEMMKNGLIDVFYLPVTDQNKMMNFMECRRTLKEILEGVNYRPTRRNWRKAIPKWKIPKICLLYTSITNR